MKNIFNLLLITLAYLHLFSVFSADWISNTYSTVTKKDTIKLPDGSVYSNFEQTGQGTSNIGKYVITMCSGNRLDKAGKLVEINIYCELEVDDGENELVQVSERSSSSEDSGASNSFDLLIV